MLGNMFNCDDYNNAIHVINKQTKCRQSLNGLGVLYGVDVQAHICIYVNHANIPVRKHERHHHPKASTGTV